MEPIIKELNITKTLSTPITVNDVEITEINISRLILRPVLKKIVFLIEELNKRVILYEGEDLYEAHKDDSDETLIAKLLEVITAEYTA